MFLTAALFLVTWLDRGQSFTRPTIPLHRQSSLSGLSYSIAGGGVHRAGPAVFDINSPDDLKDFVGADDKPAVIKVYADWCKTCKQFDLRYRKLASIWGEKRQRGSPGLEDEACEFSNLVRFAQMEYGANEEMCELLDATRVPYILIYKREGGKMAGFTCPPSKVHLLVDALHEHALPSPAIIDDQEEEAVEVENKCIESEMDMDRILAAGMNFIQDYMPQISKR